MKQGLLWLGALLLLLLSIVFAGAMYMVGYGGVPRLSELTTLPLEYWLPIGFLSLLVIGCFSSSEVSGASSDTVGLRLACQTSAASTFWSLLGRTAGYCRRERRQTHGQPSKV